MTLPLEWDSRLDAMGVKLVRAQPAAGETCFRLVKAKWLDEIESQGRHHIFVDVLDEGGQRMIGQRVIVSNGGQNVLVTEDKPPPELSCNFPMFAVLGSYSCQVEGVSDVVTGMGMGSAELPTHKLHTSFELTFQLGDGDDDDDDDDDQLFDFHYVLLGQTAESIVPWTWIEAMQAYLQRFRVTLGFSHDHAMMADKTRSRHVTIIGSPNAQVAVSQEVEQIIRDSGAEVDRVQGTTAAEIQAEMDRRAATGNRFG
jgi:hypothetical protein